MYPQVLHFVPVGYNLRLLEIMLYELYEAVDYFVLYETDATQIGVRKVLLPIIATMELPSHGRGGGLGTVVSRGRHSGCVMARCAMVRVLG